MLFVLVKVDGEGGSEAVEGVCGILSWNVAREVDRACMCYSLKIDSNSLRERASV